MKTLIASHVAAMEGYVPGEQPKRRDIVKLNTNENPYPPSPAVGRALAEFDYTLLRRYPDPMASALRNRVAEINGCTPECVFVGNGSDEVLRLAVEVFVRNAAPVGVFSPSYSLYPVLAAIREAPLCTLPLPADDAALSSLAMPDPKPDLFCLVNPNAPTGTMFGIEAVRAFARALAPSVLLLDETYVLFAGTDCMRLAFEEPNVVVSRSFSKAWSLAGLRVGVLVGPEPLVDALFKVKDSYNEDAIALSAAEAALSDPEWMQANVRRILDTRERFAEGLRSKGWEVVPSHTNFVWCRPPAPKTAEEIQARVRRWGFLVRRFADDPATAGWLRISMGTREEMEELLGLV